MSTFLVTGSQGFTGKYLVPLLQSRGHKVIGLGFKTVEWTGAHEIRECDLLDLGRLKQVIKEINPTHVAHLAGLAFVGHARDEEFYRVNTIGTLNLLSALGELPQAPQKVLLASSANVYGMPEGVEILDEKIPPAPINHYANSKLAMEHMARTWFNKMPVIIVRPFNYTGPSQEGSFLIPKIIAHFRHGHKKIELGNLNVSRDFSDVRDVSRCYSDLLESKVHSCILNVCRGQATSLQEILQLMETIAGYKIEVCINPSFVRVNEIPRLLGNNQKLREAIGFVPSIPIEQTLRDMYLA